jgi:hypothetical protein
VLVTDNALGADSITQAMSATVGGDATACATPTRDDGDESAVATEDERQSKAVRQSPGASTLARQTTPRVLVSRSRHD